MTTSRRTAGARWQRVAAVIVAAAAVPVFATGTAVAHSVLEKSNPQDGQTVSEPPRQIDLWLSEAVSPDEFSLALVDGTGTAVVTADESRSVPSEVVVAFLEEGHHVSIRSLPTLRDDVYDLRWEVVSEEDLHELAGTVVFGVGEAVVLPPSTATRVAAPGTAPVLAGWATLLALATLCGSWLIGYVLVPLANRNRELALSQAWHQRLATTALVSLGVALAMWLLRMVIQSVSTDPRGLVDLVTGTTPGLLWLSAIVTGLALSVLLELRRRSDNAASGGQGALAGGLILLLLGLRAAGSHATDGVASLLTLTVHEGATLTWAGTIMLLVIAGGRRDAQRRRDVKALFVAFGPVAAVAIVLTVVSGLLLTGTQVASIDAALRTTYGWTLALKIALVAGALLLGLRHALHHHPWLTRPRTPRARPSGSLAAEAAAAGALLLLAAGLSVTTPARGASFAPAEEAQAIVTQDTDDLLVTVQMRPNTPGRSFAMVDVFDRRRPSPGAVQAVTATLDGNTTPLALTGDDPNGNGRWQEVVDINRTGDLPLSITIERAGLPTTTVDVTWAVPTGRTPPPTLVSNAPWQPWATAAALLTLVVAMLLAGAVVTRRRHASVAQAPALTSDPADARTR